MSYTEHLEHEIDDAREALRLCQAHRDRLLDDHTKLLVEIRVLRCELEEARAEQHHIRLQYDALKDEVASVYPSEVVQTHIHEMPVLPYPVSSPGPAVSSSVDGSGSTPCYPQGPGDLPKTGAFWRIPDSAI